MDFATQVRRWRNQRGLTQAALAEAAGIPRPNLINIELGKRDCTIHTLRRLASALEITPGTLLEEAPTPIPPLDRFEMDQIAGSFWKDKPKLPQKLRMVREKLFPTIAPILRAAGKKGLTIKSMGKAWDYQQTAIDFLGKENFNHLIRRITKYAASQGNTHED